MCHMSLGKVAVIQQWWLTMKLNKMYDGNMWKVKQQ